MSKIVYVEIETFINFADFGLGILFVYKCPITYLLMMFISWKSNY